MPDLYSGSHELFLDYLRKIVFAHETVSFIGLERACGKTSSYKTFLSALEHKTLGITSIGTDHLSSANTTEENGLVYIPQNTLVATAHQTLSLCDTTKEILSKTGIFTPLGEVILFRALSAGYVFLAGPSILADSIRLRDAMLAVGAEMVLLDGAVDRKSPALPQLADGVVLSGRLFSPNFDNALEKLYAEVENLITPALADPVLAEICSRQIDSPDPYYLVDDTLTVHVPESEEAKTSLLAFLAGFKGTLKAFVIKGALTNARLGPLLKAEARIIKKMQQVPLVIEDPTKSFISSLNRSLLLKRNIPLRVLYPVNLLAICVNPLQSGLQGLQLKQTMTNLAGRFKIPVLNVFGEAYVEGF